MEDLRQLSVKRLKELIAINEKKMITWAPVFNEYTMNQLKDVNRKLKKALKFKLEKM